MSGMKQVLSTPRVDECLFITNSLQSFVHKEKPGHIPHNLSWQSISRILRQQNLEPIFAEIYQDQALSYPIQQRWKQSRRTTWIRNTRAAVAAVRIFNLLEEEKISAVALRGLGLAHYLYRDISLRPCNDVDILIRQTDKEHLARVFLAQGWHLAKRNRSQWVYYINDIKFEIHWSVLSPKRYQHLKLAKQFIDSRKPLRMDEGEIYILDAESEFIGLVLHAFLHHELEFMLPLVDLAILIRDNPLDWLFLSGWWQNAQLATLFMFTCSLVSNLFALEMEIFKESKVSSEKFYNQFYHSYLDRFFGMDSISNYILRKSMLFYSSEKLCLKIQQLIRLCSFDELQDFLGCLKETLC